MDNLVISLVTWCRTRQMEYELGYVYLILISLFLGSRKQIMSMYLNSGIEAMPGRWKLPTVLDSFPLNYYTINNFLTVCKYFFLILDT